jgi:hypothetical protein
MDGHISVKSSFSVFCFLRSFFVCLVLWKCSSQHNTREKRNAKELKKESLEHTGRHWLTLFGKVSDKIQKKFES